MPDSLSRGEDGAHRGRQDSPNIPLRDRAGVQETRMGSGHPVHLGDGAHVGVLNLLTVHDEQRDGVRRLVFLTLR